MLTRDQSIRELANELHKQKSLLVMGRGYNYATCLEGALVRWSFVLVMIQLQRSHFNFNFFAPSERSEMQ